MVITKTLHAWEDTPLTIMARVVGADQDALVKADIASIAVKVFDAANTQISTTLAPVVGDAIFDTLQTDYGWDEDSTGYNFRYEVPASYFPTGGVRERVEVVVTATSGGVFPVGAWEVHVENLQSS